MLKYYAKFTELNNKDVSAPALKRLRIIGLLSLPFVPALGLMELKGGISSPIVEPLQGIALTIIVLLSAVALLILCTNKLVNRVWVRDKYLDEWETQLKYRSMAFGFQVVLYTISAILFSGFVLYYFNMVSLEELTPGIIGYALFSLLMLGLYSQIYAQFAIVQPVEDDELDTTIPKRTVMKGIFRTTAALLVICVAIPFGISVLSEIHQNRTSEIATLSREALSVCTERGSSVHWVSIAKENYGFGCFDENRPAPEDVKNGGAQN